VKRSTQQLLAIAGGALVVWWLSRQSSQPAADTVTDFSSDPVASVSDAVTSAVSGWKNVQQGPDWVPVLNAIENAHGLPVDLLARIAYQESHFRDDIIRGLKASPAGALGMMQMLPQYFQSVKVPVPFTDVDVQNQIEEAAAQVVSLFTQFQDWSLAIAAYNAGAGNVRKYGGIPPFPETQSYVAAVVADVPALSGAA
jgi:soluble lytic murein transglycosylase-like protein